MFDNTSANHLCCSEYNAIGDNIDITTYFQPIIALKNKTIIGYESLCRGICKECGRIIYPYELFTKITLEKNLFNLDFLARKSAFADFSKLVEKDKNILLFLNFDVSLVGKGIETPDMLADLLEEFNINPQNIVVEITESKPCDLSVLAKFMTACKAHGFLIALDDVGTGYSNLDRILTIRPDILKIDRSIISDINNNYHKKAVFRTLSRLARKIGTFILAEGVETEEEVVYCVELGAELLQGFYFTVPKKIDNNLINEVNDKITYTTNKCNQYKIDRIDKLKEQNQLFDGIITYMAKVLSEKTFNEINEIESFLASHIQKYDFVESVYLIDNKGLQITDTILNHDKCLRRTLLYKPKQKNDSHSYKDYFYYLQDGPFKKYSTDTFISLLTGHLCRTLSLQFNDKNNNSHIICMDIKESK